MELVTPVRRLLAIAVVALLAMPSSGARATVGPVTVRPTSIYEGETALGLVTTEACDLLLTLGEDDRRVRVAGSVVTITVRGIGPSNSLCIYPSTDFGYRFGPLPAGAYQIRLVREDYFAPAQTDLLGVSAVTVLPAASVPTNTPPGLIVCVAGIFLFWYRTVGRRARAARSAAL